VTCGAVTLRIGFFDVAVAVLRVRSSLERRNGPPLWGPAADLDPPAAPSRYASVFRLRISGGSLATQSANDFADSTKPTDQVPRVFRRPAPEPADLRQSQLGFSTGAIAR